MIKERYQLKDFMPLIILAIVITIFATVATYMMRGDSMFFMRMFMAGFFVIFGGLKLVSLKDFVSAYKMYDVIAARVPGYGIAYPFIEVALGIGYLTNIAPMVVNSITIFVMVVGAVGVLRVLLRGEKILCACMGAVFKVPMTWVTLGENLLMAAMAVWMLSLFI